MDNSSLSNDRATRDAQYRAERGAPPPPPGVHWTNAALLTVLIIGLVLGFVAGHFLW